ncbi:MAG: site-2 protease family protein [Spirulina sp. SIO3F2]|nr:site-2 protease family protein [Spirulina sp. SIO3F2]
MKGNLRFGQLFGIPFFVNPSWFLVLALGTLSLADDFGRLPSIQALGSLAIGGAIALGLITTLLLFASVLAHELGHSAAAIAQGIEVKSITLFIFGGLALLAKDAQTPMKSLAIAIAGPLVSFGLFFLLTFVQLTMSGLPLTIIVMLKFLAGLNLILGLFNLIPGMPLDGGNVLRAVVWQITGNPSTGLLWASRTGQGFGIFAITIGALGFLGISPYGSLWTAFLGFFLLQNAGLSAQSAQIQSKLDQRTVEDALISGPVVVQGNRSIRGFVNDYVIGKTALPLYIVTDEQGKYLGLIKPSDLNTIATSRWTEITLVDLLNERIQDEAPLELTTIRNHQSLLTAVPLLEQNPNQPLLVVNNYDQILGLLTRSSVRDCLAAVVPDRTVEIKTAVPPE